MGRFAMDEFAAAWLVTDEGAVSNHDLAAYCDNR